MLEYRQVISSVPLYRSKADSCALLWLPEQAPEEITLADAVQDMGLCASFLFFAAPPELSGQAAVQALYDRVSAELEAQKPYRRAILWHTGTDAYPLALNDAAAQTQSALEIPLTQGRRFRVARSAKLAFQSEGGCLLFQNDSTLSFVPEIKSVRSGGRILLEEGGAVCFDMYMEYAELLNSLSPGWEYRFPAGDGKDRSLSFSLLRADGIGPSEVKFQARFDPCREEARTLTFAQLKGQQPIRCMTFSQPTRITRSFLESGCGLPERNMKRRRVIRWPCWRGVWALA